MGAPYFRNFESLKFGIRKNGSRPFFFRPFFLVWVYGSFLNKSKSVQLLLLLYYTTRTVLHAEVPLVDLLWSTMSSSCLTPPLSGPALLQYSTSRITIACWHILCLVVVFPFQSCRNSGTIQIRREEKANIWLKEVSYVRREWQKGGNQEGL